MHTTRSKTNLLLPFLIFLLFTIPPSSLNLYAPSQAEPVPASAIMERPEPDDGTQHPRPFPPAIILDTNSRSDRLQPVIPVAPAIDLLSFEDFVAEVADGQDEFVRGVYVPGVLALPVTQQPDKNPAFVSPENRAITEFQQAARNNITGLLAHNYLSGALFYHLVPGQEVRVVYGDGAVKKYRVDRIQSFQKLTPSSLRSEFIDLDTGQKLSTIEVFDRFYRGKHRLIFQTCLEREGKLNWGLIFVVATPLGDQD